MTTGRMQTIDPDERRTVPAPIVPSSLLLASRGFRAMNTQILLVVADYWHSALLSAAEDVFHEVEARFSRFLPESELSRFNTRVREVARVSRDLFEILSQALGFHRSTAGVFDPAILPQLEGAGYDRSFEQVDRDSAVSPTPVPVHHSIGELALDPARLEVRAPAGLRIDLGGIGKGFAVDRAARVLAPARSYLVDAGGDILAAGDGPDGGGWRVGVANPARPEEDLDEVVLRDQAIATSTTSARRWRRGGRWLNHLIDPRTGQPVESNVISVSVIAPSATSADVYAKSALLLGPREGARLLGEQGFAGLFVGSDGHVVHAVDWPSAR